jgi:anti-anti-sigma factor
MSIAPFEITRQDLGPAHVLVLRGELDLASAPQLGEVIAEAIELEPERLVVDLCGVDFIDSAGLAVLLNARRRSLRRGIDLRLACDVPSTLKLLALTRLDHDFDIRSTREAALAA